MGKSSRAKYFKRFKKESEPPKELELVVEDSVEVQEVVEETKIEEPPVEQIEEVVTDVVAVPNPKPVQPKPSVTYNPNSANNLLNSILTTLLTQEYNRLQQQLMNIRQQLDEQKLVSEPTNKDQVALYTDVQYTDGNGDM